MKLAVVENLTYTPWARVNGTDAKGRPKAEIVRAFRADSITMADATRRSAS